MPEAAITVSAERLHSFIKRIERLNEDKAAVAEDLTEVYSEVRSAGFDAKIVRKIVALRKVELEKRREESALMETYMSALGLEE